MRCTSCPLCRMRELQQLVEINSGEEMEHPGRLQQAGAPKEQAKKPYVKPRCLSEPIYETLALACGKIGGQSALCNAVPRRS